MKNMYEHQKYLLGVIFLLLSTFIQDVGAAKIPVTIFDFTTDKQGWITHDLAIAITHGDLATSWNWTPNAYSSVPAGNLYITPGSVLGSGLRNSWVISPVIELKDVTAAEFYLTYAHRYGTETGNRMYLYAQIADSVNLNRQGDSAFVAQWGTTVKINLDQSSNAGMLGISNTGYDGTKPHTTSALNLSMFDGKKIRLGIHFYNQDPNSANNSKNVYVHSLTLAGTVNDIVPPVIAMDKIDSIGNTFARGRFMADGITKVNWGVKVKGETVADLAALMASIGTSSFVSSGVVSVNQGGRDILFDIKGLTVNTEYTFFYGGQDFSGNASGVASVDFKTGNDLAAPVIQSIEMANLTCTSVTPRLLADEVGSLVYRLYAAGWEPQTVAEFNAGTNSVRSGTLKFDTLGVAKNWDLTSLTPNTGYIVYATVTDFTGNVSTIFKSAVFTTPADNVLPVINSMTVTDVTNHGATLKLTASEPAAGYGNAYAYWMVTAKGVTLGKEDVIARRGALASGISAKLDSATRVNTILLDNLEKNTEYRLHAVVQDASMNISNVDTIAFKTTNDLESILAYSQGFDVLNQNYHFVDVVVPAGKVGWSSFPTTTDGSLKGYVQCTNTNTASAEPSQDSWCIVGPIDLKGLVDIAAQLQFRASYGLYLDHMQMWVSKSYKPGETFSIDKWTKISEAGEFPKDNLVHTINKNVPVGFDTAGVYIGLRFYHTTSALTYRLFNLNLYGKSIGTGEQPVIDWVESIPTTTTTGEMTFAASNNGRGFYYLAKDKGSAPVAPTLQQVIGGDGAAVSGYFEYTAGNYIDQKFIIAGMEPNTKYHLYSGFRDVKYNWADGVYYDASSTVIQTPALNLVSLDDSVVYSTNLLSKATASTTGKIYWTIKGVTDPAPGNMTEIISSFNPRGSLTYSSVNQSVVNWTISNLKPDSSYVCYGILTDADAKYSSPIMNFAVNTPKMQILTANYDTATVMSVGSSYYALPFNATASCAGKLYVTLTDVSASQPSLDSLVAGTAGFASVSLNVTTPANIAFQVDSLSSAQSQNFNAWLVLKSGDYVSEVLKLTTLSTSVGNLVKASDFELWSSNGSIVLNLYKSTDKPVRIMDLTGRILIEKSLNIGQNQIGSLHSGLYIVMVELDNKVYAKKVVVK